MHTKKHSIRNKIVIWAVGFALILALAAASASFILSARYLRQSQQQSALTNIHVLGNNLDSDIDSVLTFANWICLDSTISNYLNTVERSYAQDEALGRKLSLSAWNHLTNEFNIVGVRNLVDRVVIATPNGTHFLQTISSGDTQSVSDVPITIMDSEFFEEVITAPTYKWSGFYGNPLSRTGTPKVLPIVRPVYSANSSRVMGWVYIDIPIQVITDSLKSFVLLGDDALYITLSPGATYRYTQNDLTKDTVPEDAISSSVIF